MNANRGYERLLRFLGTEQVVFLTLPRVLMHEMPDDWQARMADLLQEWDETWDTSDCPGTQVQAVVNNRFVSWPGWLLDYRHPDKEQIDKARRKTPTPDEVDT